MLLVVAYTTGIHKLFRPGATLSLSYRLAGPQGCKLGQFIEVVFSLLNILVTYYSRYVRILLSHLQQELIVNETFDTTFARILFQYHV
jgi:hypothetical protein